MRRLRALRCGLARQSARSLTRVHPSASHALVPVNGHPRLLFAFCANAFRSVPSLPPLVQAYITLNNEAAQLRADRDRLAAALAARDTELHESQARAQDEIASLRQAVAAATDSSGTANAALAAAMQATLASALTPTTPGIGGDHSFDMAAIMGRGGAGGGELDILGQLKAMADEFTKLRADNDEKAAALKLAEQDLAESRESCKRYKEQGEKMSELLDQLKGQLSSSQADRDAALGLIDGVRSAFLTLSDMKGVDKMGWLSKQGKRIKIWHKRLYVLRGTMMFYFKDEESVKVQKPLGFFGIEECVGPSTALLRCVTAHTRSSSPRDPLPLPLSSLPSLPPVRWCWCAQIQCAPSRRTA